MADPAADHGGPPSPAHRFAADPQTPPHQVVSSGKGVWASLSPSQSPGITHTFIPPSLPAFPIGCPSPTSPSQGWSPCGGAALCPGFAPGAAPAGSGFAALGTGSVFSGNSPLSPAVALDGAATEMDCAFGATASMDTASPLGGSPMGTALAFQSASTGAGDAFGGDDQEAAAMELDDEDNAENMQVDEPQVNIL